MSVSFRLRYLLGLIPSAKKIDSDWSKLLKMQDKLRSIENSKELARYNELNSLIQSSQFQFQKKEIINLKYVGSPEYHTVRELNTLEKSKSLKEYFEIKKSSKLERFQRIAESKELHRYEELKKIVESSTFQHRKKELEDLKYKGSLEYQKRMEFISLSKSGKLKLYYKTLESSDYLLFKELNSPDKKKILEQAENKKSKDPQLKIYWKFQKSGRYKNLKIIEHRGLAEKFERLRREVRTDSFLEKEAFLKDANRYKGSKDYLMFKEFSHLVKNEDIQFIHKFQRFSRVSEL